jgi:hypothetical protein
MFSFLFYVGLFCILRLVDHYKEAVKQFKYFICEGLSQGIKELVFYEDIIDRVFA